MGVPLRVRFVSLAVGLGGTIVLSSTALADSPSPSAADTGSGTVATAAFNGAGWLVLAVLLILIFGLLVLSGLLTYLNVAENRYYLSVHNLARLGRDSAQDPVGSTGQGVTGAAAAVDGPTTITVGTATTYKVSGSNVPASPAWTVDPADAASVNPATGAQVSVTAAKPGAFKLTATDPGNLIQVAPISIAALASNPQVTKLPFVGQGWGSIAIALVVADLAAVLGIAGILPGAVIATLYGTLLGYLFGAKAPAGDSTPPAATPPVATPPPNAA
jgi:hypothetical protein